MAFAACTLVCGVGFGLFQVSNNQTMFLAAPAHRSAAGGGMQGSARLTGQATGSVVVAFLFSLSPMALVSVPAVLVGAALFVIAAASVSLVSMARQAKTPHQLTEPA
jgi:DHA2 family multidrug resistance protein-like MFS transporter